MADYIWDTETFPNVHLLGCIERSSGKKIVCEISPRRDDRKKIKQLFDTLAAKDHRMIGFNNLAYDNPLELYLLKNLMYMDQPTLNQKLYEKSRQLTKPGSKGFEHMVWESDWLVDQVDVFKISHFDNVNRATSLKDLEYAMRAETIMDLPYDFREPVPLDGIPKLAEYMIDHDCVNTLRYYELIEPKMALREDYSKRLGRNFTNHNDTKMGKNYTQIRIEDTGYSFYTYTEHGKQKKQTPRRPMPLHELILPFVKFYTPEFQSMLSFLNSYTITKTKEVFNDLPTEIIGDLKQYTTGIKKQLKRKDKIFPERIKSLNVQMGGVVYELGTGGLHACVDPCHATTDDQYMILDVDVTSYYPSIIIDHQVAPAHVGTLFCDVFKKMKTERISYPKGTPENAMLKLALNGTYGDLNSEFSVFYDPAAAMKITLNGQLMLMMLAETLVTNPLLDAQLLQANTDGITLKFRKSDHEAVKHYCAQWEQVTSMQLEHAEYSDMWIKDVNNYIARYTNGKLKLKGAAFAHEFEKTDDWAKNFSFRIIQKATVAHLVHGDDIEEFIMSHDDTYDFTSRAKVQRSHKLLCDGVEQQRISRYYMSTNGGTLTKEMPPLAGKTDPRVSIVPPTGGRKVTIINDTTYVDKLSLDYDFYITQVRDVVDKIKERVV